ncbi:dolichyl-diphosphooligosaccharide---protein glycotransferase [Synchytrium endobioticum]|uniref:Dolichyl-diphosphooligosaccharide---protein glycotransferase n=1 Tax=Synchytrium endobioticum TaxID=286115 RepID=A0A507DRL2_9FUNG|nr:dolichyl-diphosphooligosaccharide---protein glycotransferase [Synchytrium endobioticum]
MIPLRPKSSIICLFLAISLVMTGINAKKTIQVKDVVFTIAQSDDRKVTEKLSHPNKLPTTLPPIHNTDTIKLSFTPSLNDGSAIKLKQAVLSFRSTDDVARIATQWASKLDGTGTGTGSQSWGVTIDMGSTATMESFLGHSGRYSVTLYIATLDAALAYDLGAVSVLFAGPAVVPKPSIPESFTPGPEIHHVFRAPDAMASVWLSRVFTVLVLAPWSFLVGAWGIGGANVKNFFEPSSSFGYGGVFFSALGAWVFLFYQYWLRLNLFQLLYYGGLLGVITIVVGRWALVHRAQLRLNKAY